MLFDSLLSLLAPHDCLSCTAEGALLCHDCQAHIKPAIPRCYKCQTPGKTFATCPTCRAGSPLSSAHAAACYDGIAKDIIWKLKFGRSRSAGNELARILVGRLTLRQLFTGKPLLRGSKLIVCHAPTATVRVRQRGYDQAAVIARAIARDCGLTYHPLLRRRGHQEQIGASKAQRTAQLTHAFYAVQTRHIAGAHILLIDDVITTGATLESAARVLMAAGARRVDAIVFAQA